ncbi:bifunctional diaminohydroxyphosphoribosylaminopyrimidine deaminase/5-amino-6-(5-phosphoribosylamino)uracil reductase RibD [Aurantivibrio infirmus]
MPDSMQNISVEDQVFMTRAIALAKRGLYTANPNPMVGCVLVSEGRIIGEGWHQIAGEAHAEINAIADAKKRGHETKAASAYVSLEPCSFQGKTGPCSEALITAGIKKVFYAMQDPNPQVAGRGVEQMREAGIDVIGPVLEKDAREINPGFIKRMEQGLPFVRIKMAMSLDGRTAMSSGESKWITGPNARSDGQRLRARSCAIVTGIETVLHDDPLLNVRAEELQVEMSEHLGHRQPLRVVLDSRGRLNKNARMFSIPGEVVLGTLSGSSVDAELGKNVTRVDLDPKANKSRNSKPEEKSQQVDLKKLLQYLASRQCNEVLVEAGATLAGQFIQQGLVDEIIVYMAPKLMGSNARPVFELPIESMAGKLSLRISDVRAIDQDWRITATIDPES